jgi:hypothetical protein
MREIANVLYNENFNEIRNEINKNSSGELKELYDCLINKKAFTYKTNYLMLYLINQKYGTCDVLFEYLGKKTSFNLKNIIRCFELCNSLHDLEFSNMDIAKEQINDYDDIYGLNIDTKILVCNGSITYLILLITKLMEANAHKSEFNNDYDRYRHILENQIYITSNDSIKNFYTSLILDINDEFVKNITTCDYLYHNNRLNIVKYDLAIGMSPQSDGKINRSLNYVYDRYIKKSTELAKVTSLLTPSRWFQTYSGDLKRLISFRNTLIKSNKVRLLNYFKLDTDPLNTGGMSYLMLDNNYKGKCLYKKQNEYVDLTQFDVIFKNSYDYKLNTKLSKYKSINSLFLGTCDSGIKINDRRLKDEIEEKCIKVYVSKRYNNVKWLPINNIFSIRNIFSYKVISSETTSTGSGFNNFIIAKPLETYDGSYFGLLVKDEIEANSLISYLQTDFVNKLLMMRKIKNHINYQSLKSIPCVPLNRNWNDKELIKYFKLTENEKKAIYESN